jgi:hypothetical protein
MIDLHRMLTRSTASLPSHPTHMAGQGGSVISARGKGGSMPVRCQEQMATLCS